MGAFLGCFFSLLALPVMLLRGAEEFPSALVLIYLLGGILGGIVVGVLQPWIRTRLRAMLVGVIVFLPIGTAFMRQSGEFGNWGSDEIGGVLLGSVILGAMAGRVFWKDHGRSSSSISHGNAASSSNNGLQRTSGRRSN